MPANTLKYSNIPVPDPTVLTTEALRREIDNLANEVERALKASAELTDEKFRNIEAHFALIEERRVEQKADTQSAVNAALIAQKETGAKSEATTTKQLDQQSAFFTNSIKAVADQLTDVKDRMTRIESGKQGGAERSQSVNTVLIAILAIVSIGSIIANFLQHFAK